MQTSNNFDLMMETMTELEQEKQVELKSPQNSPQSVTPSLTSILSDISPLPKHALFLGMAEDDLPVLLNLNDPVPGPILIAGDKSSGKTKLLQMIARTTDLIYSPSESQYAVITPYPDEWKKFYSKNNNAQIYSTQDDNTKELLQSLVTWAHRNKGEQQSVLLLIDDLEAMTKLDEQAKQNLRWLLLRGTSRRVWTFVSLNATQALHLKEWLEFFHTRLFGRVENSGEAYLLTGNRNQTLNHLTQFALRENNNLLGFYAPSID
jgi:tRNA A37 threonylcarbamoyladenosine biosynthesis protein TsaE